jgi:hypothetical protein
LHHGALTGLQDPGTVKGDPMIRITFDSNCIFLLDENGPKTTFVHHLINYHNQGKITIQIPLIMAYENRLGERRGMPLDRYRDAWRNLERDLRQKIEDHGFNREPDYLPRYALVLEPELYPGENLYPTGEETIALFKKVQDIIHPDLNFERMLQSARKKFPEAEFAPSWRRAYIDIHICLNHIISNADFLLSNDEDIYGKAKELERCGARRVLICSIDDQKILKDAIEGVRKIPKKRKG